MIRPKPKRPQQLRAMMSDFFRKQDFRQLMAYTVWEDINNPDVDHPVHRLARPPAKRRFRRAVRWIGWGIMYLAGIPMAIFAFPLIGLLLLATNTLAGMQLAATISGTINKYRTNDVYDMLAITPDGGTKAVWLLGLGAMQPTSSYKELASWRKWVPRVVFILPFGVGALIIQMYLLFVVFDSPTAGVFSMVELLAMMGWWALASLSGGVIAMLLYYDNIASIATATLTGLIIPRWIHRQGVAQGTAYAAFTVMQLTIYLTAMFAVAAIGSVLDGIGFAFYLYYRLPEWIVTVAVVIYLTVLSPTLLILFRETTVRILWYIYQRQNSDRLRYNESAK